ncbi:sirohydrochlorin chelatase [Streptomyces gamaensis]|uniref:Sirohydrochlorin chelatase n=1 Tax=Streptomyces gamaensis TaxID=1763542 RepID=A0ABW0ZBA8_9ACTN
MTPALLLVAHGSRDPRHAATVAALRERVARLRPGARVAAGYLDFCLPSVPRALEGLAARAGGAVAVPLLLTHAFHARCDLPAVLRSPRPPLRVARAGVLGPSPLLTAALERRLDEAGLPPGERARTGVVLAAAGTSDPRARAGLVDVARAWERTGWYAVRPAFASASGPRVAEAVRALRDRGAARVAVAPYVLAPGRLPDRIAAGAHAAGADVLAEPLGAAPEVAELVWQRYEEAVPAGAERRALPA